MEEAGDSDYDLTEEQMLAMLQMQHLQQQERLEDDEWDPNAGIFGEMDYSTFVTQRLKEVNEQWDKEPLPDDSTRHKLIEFKKDQELTSVYAPTLYPGEENDETQDETIEHKGDKVDNFVPEEIHPMEDKSSTSARNKNDKQNSPRIVDSDFGGLSGRPANKQNGDSNTVLPGETLVTSKDGQPIVKRKKKSLSFSDNTGDRGDNNDRREATSESSKNDDVEDNQQKNKNNNSAISADNGEDEDAGNIEKKDSSSTRSRSPEASPKNRGDKNESNGENNSSTDSKKEEKVLVELNGKFELISVKEYQSMSHLHLNDDSSESSYVEGNAESYSHHQRSARPTSSVGSRSSSTPAAGDRRRAQSASSSRSANRSRDWDASDYRSPYALTPEQKDLKDRREKIIREREKAQKERKEEEDKKKHEEAESAFQWWLGKKEEERAEKSSVNKQNKSEDEQARKDENVEAFNAWCEAKNEQRKKDRLLKTREQKERDDAYFIRSRDECELAFKRWLRNKKKEQIIQHPMSATKAKSKRKKSRSKNGMKGDSSSNKSADYNNKTR